LILGGAILNGWRLEITFERSGLVLSEAGLHCETIIQ
jgi:hypothetical protein